MSVPETREIIINQHYFDFEENLYDSLTCLYRKHAYLCSDDKYLKDMRILCGDGQLERNSLIIKNKFYKETKLSGRRLVYQQY